MELSATHLWIHYTDNVVSDQENLWSNMLRPLSKKNVLPTLHQTQTIEQGAEYVGLSVNTLYKLRSQNKITKSSRYNQKF